jgi:predicted SnoaL-like aldol condensation-catalyzing enzyme
MTKKEIADSFLQLASSGRVQEAYEKYVHPSFTHHNPYFKGDRETLLKGMEDNAKQFPNKTCESIRALEDGELVAVHSKITLEPGQVYNVIHIFRFEGDRIVEEWEAGHQVNEEMSNENGVF